MSFAKEVWEKLSSIDVNEHVKKKGTLSYLSWAWAWGELKKAYPESNYQFKEPVFYGDGTCEVWVTLTVADGDKSLSHIMWLPVMDHRNNAIKNPDARKIGDARMRCLTKAIAMCGLGHYIYAGEDLPAQNGDYDEVISQYTPEQKDQYHTIFKSGDSLAMWVFRRTVGDEVYAGLAGTFGPGKKMENKAIIASMENEAINLIQQFTEELEAHIDNGDPVGIAEVSQLPGMVKKEVFKNLSPEHKEALKRISQQKQAA